MKKMKPVWRSPTVKLRSKNRKVRDKTLLPGSEILKMWPKPLVQQWNNLMVPKLSKVPPNRWWTTDCTESRMWHIPPRFSTNSSRPSWSQIMTRAFTSTWAATSQKHSEKSRGPSKYSNWSSRAPTSSDSSPTAQSKSGTSLVRTGFSSARKSWRANSFRPASPKIY